MYMMYNIHYIHIPVVSSSFLYKYSTFSVIFGMTTTNLLPFASFKNKGNVEDNEKSRAKVPHKGSKQSWLERNYDQILIDLDG